MWWMDTEWCEGAATPEMERTRTSKANKKGTGKNACAVTLSLNLLLRRPVTTVVAAIRGVMGIVAGAGIAIADSVVVVRVTMVVGGGL